MRSRLEELMKEKGNRCIQRRKVEVLQSAAGYYIGTFVMVV